MTISLKTKVLSYIAVVVIGASLLNAILSVSMAKKSIEQQLVARGEALSEALARSVDDGLAQENLNLIKQVEDIVHTDDVLLTQVFSTLWLGVAAVPPDQLNLPPDPGAREFFTVHKREVDHYSRNEGAWVDIYSPVVFDPHDPRVPRVLIGYVRLRITTEQITEAVRQAILINLGAAALLMLVSVLFLSALIGKFVLRPILTLHRTMARHKQGEFFETVPITSTDEISELSAEFNQLTLALKEREEKLAEEKERLAVTLRSIGDAVIVTDLNGTITMMNRVAEQHTGWTTGEAVGRPFTEVFRIIDEKTRERCENPIDRVVRSGLVCGLANHTVLIKRDGSEIVIEDSGAPIRDKDSRIIGVVLVFRDMTEKKKMEEELLKMEKLQSVGLLAGGLAHDFNNLLTALLGNISMAKLYVDPRSKAYQRLAEAETASHRATDLTQQLLTFSKGGAPIRKTSSIMPIIREASAFALSGTKVASQFSAPPDLWSLDVDAGQMSQVFNNLIINAAQAMPEGGLVTITAGNTVLARNEVPVLKEGPYVTITVHDNGPGIPEEYLGRIFEPYFTTKPKGSGLGLASAYSVIKRHDGHITVASSASAGTTFTIYLPAVPGKTAKPEAAHESVSVGRGRILIMDDEEVIRELAAAMLHELGYDAETAADGKEALEKYRKALTEGRRFSTVIMDLTIPGGMGGKETIRELLALDPDVKAVVSSGYSNDPIMADYGNYGFKGVITKPYDISAFSKVLNDVVVG